MNITRRRALALSAAAPLAAALPAISAPGIEGLAHLEGAVAAILPPSADAWFAAYSVAHRQAFQDQLIYGLSGVMYPEGGLPYAIDPLSLMRGPGGPA